MMKLKLANLQSYTFKTSLTVALTVLLAMLINYHFIKSGDFWLVLSAFLTVIIIRKEPLRQGVLACVIMMIAILFSTSLSYSNSFTFEYIIISFIFIIASVYITYKGYYISRSHLIFWLFPLIVLIGTYSKMMSHEMLRQRLIDILIGWIIGIICNQIILPVRVVKEFYHDVIPILNSIKHFSAALMAGLLDEKSKSIAVNKDALITNLLMHQAIYPEWVFAVGFNPSLRGGFRFFLVNIDRVVEILFVMSDLISNNRLISDDIDNSIQIFERPVELEKNVNLRECAKVVMETNVNLILLLIKYFSNNELIDVNSDYTSDILALDNALKKIVPQDIELLDISPEYLNATRLVQEIKDLRNILLQLVMALPPITQS